MKKVKALFYQAWLKHLKLGSEWKKLSKEWSEGIFKIFDSFPRFDWEK